MNESEKRKRALSYSVSKKQLPLLICILLILNACQSLQATPSPPAETQAPDTGDPASEIPMKRSPRPHLTPKITEEISEVPTLVAGTPGSEIFAQDALTITILYDNYPYDQRLKTAWGFAALVEYREHVLLFDTGGEGPIFIDNLQTLGIDPTRIQSVLLSHAHGDHTGGLSALLGTGVRPVVYPLPSFTGSIKYQVDQITTMVETAPEQPIAEGLYTTGEIRYGIPEQALVVDTSKGLVVITGCAHPGIVRIVERAKTAFDRPVHLVLGGFHLVDQSDSSIAAILEEFRRLGVEKVAPCHCTGDQAIGMFKQEYGADFVQVGVGKEIVVNGE